MVDKIFGGSLAEGRTGATTTLIVLGLCFILLLERGPGREHITIQSYMLAMVAGLGALYALALAAAPVREFFDLELLSAGPVVPLSDLRARPGWCSRRHWRTPLHPELEAPAEPPAESEDPAPEARRPRNRDSPKLPDPRGRQARGAAMSDHATRPERRTKIVATVGPATRTVEGLTSSFERVWTSCGSTSPTAHARTTRANVAMAREAAEAAGREVGLLGDLPGPKLRIDEVEGGVVELREGSELTLTTDEGVGAADRLPSLGGAAPAVHEGDEVYLADGRVRLRVLGASARVRCGVEVGGGSPHTRA